MLAGDDAIRGTGQSLAGVMNDRGGQLHECRDRYPGYTKPEKQIGQPFFLLGLLGGMDQIDAPGKPLRVELFLDLSAPAFHFLGTKTRRSQKTQHPGLPQGNHHGRGGNTQGHLTAHIGKTQSAIHQIVWVM
uniref:Uncharacterized protein n=1 Tax=Candidatus Kentrum sp. LFY TaxID=2126342 RepID=A0A450V114_9GAMM|nr:MAG: hypothetical protein BECKLFY1418B_GA0070995_11221 [Candidatus Kentron sp. LFY]